MSTHNVCFHGELRKILCGYRFLPGAITIITVVTFHNSRQIASQDKSFSKYSDKRICTILVNRYSNTEMSSSKSESPP